MFLASAVVSLGGLTMPTANLPGWGVHRLFTDRGDTAGGYARVDSSSP